jgi:hypothetical protein
VTKRPATRNETTWPEQAWHLLDIPERVLELLDIADVKTHEMSPVDYREV